MLPAFQETQTGFVDERRGLKSVAGPLLGEAPARQPAELVVDERRQRREVSPTVTVRAGIRTGAGFLRYWVFC